jgi:hypothetical protein
MITKADIGFYLDARHGIIPLVGADPVHTRSTIGTWHDENGVLRTAPINTPRFNWADVGTETRPVLRTDPAVTNLMPQSENTGAAPWSDVGTPTRTAAAHVSCGVALDLLGDDDAATAEGKRQTVTLTGNAVKSGRVVAKQSTSTGSVVRFRDTTAGADRLIMLVQWNADGTPNVTMTNGVYLGSSKRTDGAYTLYFRTDSCTAANTHQYTFYPATTTAFAVGNTGDIYVGGFQLQNARNPGAYVKNTTTTASMGADTTYFTAPAKVAAFMMYLRFVERGMFDEGANGTPSPRLWNWGKGDGTQPFIDIRVISSLAGYRLVNNPGSAANATLAVAPAWGDLVELLVYIQATGAGSLVQSINGAAVTAAALASNQALVSPMSDTRFWFGNDLAGNAGIMELLDAKFVSYAAVAAVTDQTRMEELRALEMNSGGEVINNGST